MNTKLSHDEQILNADKKVKEFADSVGATSHKLEVSLMVLLGVVFPNRFSIYIEFEDGRKFGQSDISFPDCFDKIKSTISVQIKNKLNFINEFNGQKQTKITLDRTRTVSYNGSDVNINSFKCSDCNKDYFFEETSHNFCPFCGSEYKHTADVSI